MHHLKCHMSEEEVSLWDPQGLDQNSLACLQTVLFGDNQMQAEI